MALAEDAERHGVVGDHDRRRPRARLEHPRRRHPAAFGAEVGLVDAGRDPADVAVQARLEGAPPQLRGREARRPADEGDAPVAQLGEVAERVGEPGPVVDGEVADPRAGAAGVEEHDRDVPPRQLVDQLGVHLRRHERHATDAPLDEPADIARHAVGVVVGVGEDHLVAVLVGGGLDPLHQLREERVRDVGHDQADQVAPARRQGACVGVGVVLAAADDAEDLVADLAGDAAGFVQDAGDGRRGDPRLGGDVGEPDVGAHALAVARSGTRLFHLLLWNAAQANGSCKRLQGPPPKATRPQGPRDNVLTTLTSSSGRADI
jgi:hypothetical protein